MSYNTSTENITQSNNGLNDISRMSENGDRQRKDKKCIWLEKAAKPLSAKENPLPPSPSVLQRARYALLCPPHGVVARQLTLVVVVIIIWAVGIGMFGPLMEFGGHGFAFLAIYVLSVVAGNLAKIAHLPALMGMLLAGVAAKNIPGLRGVVGDLLNKKASTLVRRCALVVILTRAGLHMDPQSVKRVGVNVVILAVLPPIIEAFAAGTAAYYLRDFSSYSWGMLLGFVMSAVSPAVIVPSFLRLQEKGYGVNKGIPILGIAASSVNDAASVTGFGIALGITFATGEVWRTAIQGPLEILFAILYAAILGTFVWYIPSPSDNKARAFRFILLFGGGLLAMFGFQYIDFDGAGALATLLFTCVAAYGWKREGDKNHHAVSAQVAVLWAVMQPMLFSLVGAEVDLSTLEGDTVGSLMGVLFIGLCARALSGALLVRGFNMKERLFIGIAWIPKATVQAAIGPLALDMVHGMKDAPKSYDQQAMDILTVAVLAILITAPLGAMWIALSGPKLLRRLSPEARKSLSIAMQAKREGITLDPEAFRGLPSPPSVSSELNMMVQEEEIIQKVQSF